jgi:hypothetical protein
MGFVARRARFSFARNLAEFPDGGRVFERTETCRSTASLSLRSWRPVTSHCPRTTAFELALT